MVFLLLFCNSHLDPKTVKGKTRGGGCDLKVWNGNKEDTFQRVRGYLSFLRCWCFRGVASWGRWFALGKKNVFVDPCHSKVRVHSQDHQKVHGRLAGNPRRGLTQVVWRKWEVQRSPICWENAFKLPTSDYWKLPERFLRRSQQACKTPACHRFGQQM